MDSGRRVWLVTGMRGVWLAIWIGATGCRPARTVEPTVAVGAEAEVVRVRGCVTVDGAAAPRAEVVMRSAAGVKSPVGLDGRGCFAVERAVGAVNGLMASAPGRGFVSMPVLAVAGTVEVEMAVPTAGAFAAAVVRSADRASELAAVAGWYAVTLRGNPTREHLEAVVRRWRGEEDAVVRATLGLVYLVLARTPGVVAASVDVGLLRAAVAAVGPEHVGWSVEMEAVVLAERAGDIDTSYVRRMLEQHADPLVYGGAALVLASGGTRDGKTDEVRAVLGRLRERGAVGSLASMAIELDPQDVVANGKPLPAFRLRRLDRDGVVDSAELRGKVVVLHVWVTWCAPCVEQIPALAKLYEQHAAAGLEIVSLSTDEDAAVVRRFVEATPMPWTLAWEPPATAEELRRRYQVVDSTKTMLIGRDGVMIAEELHATHPLFAAKLAEALR